MYPTGKLCCQSCIENYHNQAAHQSCILLKSRRICTGKFSPRQMRLLSFFVITSSEYIPLLSAALHRALRRLLRRGPYCEPNR